MDDVITDISDETRFLSVEEQAAATLDDLSETLLESAEAMQSLATMTEPVLADAIAIAREILRKLKLKFGETKVLDELSVRISEDVSDVEELSLVAQTLEHLLAWSRTIDASIMGDPSIQAAINAVGQVAFIVKMESLRLAKKSRDMFLADSIRQRMMAVNAKFKAPSAKNFGELLDTIERGINRVLAKVQDLGMSGAGISHTLKEIGGGFMSAPPTAGLGMQQGAEARAQSELAAKKNADILLAQEMAAQAEAARIASQNAARQRQQGQMIQPTTRTGTGRQAVQQARTQQRSTNLQNQTAQQTNQARIQANLHHQQEEEERHHHQKEMELQRVRDALARKAAEQAAARKAAEKAAAQKLAEKALADRTAAAQKLASTMKPDLLKGFSMQGVTGAPVATSSKDIVRQMVVAQVPPATVDPSQMLPPLPPTHPMHKGISR